MDPSEGEKFAGSPRFATGRSLRTCTARTDGALQRVRLSAGQPAERVGSEAENKALEATAKAKLGRGSGISGPGGSSAWGGGGRRCRGRLVACGTFLKV